MSLASYCRRLKEMTWSDRALLAEATVALAVASVAIGVLPFRKVVGALSPPRSPGEVDPEADTATITRTRWAIEACARVLPWRTVCFQKGLAMYWLLRRRGVESLLHYGVTQDEERGLKAHVWLTHNGNGIIGQDQAADFACLATFPSSRSAGAVSANATSMPNP